MFKRIAVIIRYKAITCLFVWTFFEKAYELYQLLYNKFFHNSIDGILFFGPTKITSSKIFNQLNSQLIKFIMVGDGYQRLAPGIYEFFSTSNIFIYANTRFSRRTNSLVLELYNGIDDIESQIDLILRQSNKHNIIQKIFSRYPLSIEVFCNNSYAVTNVLKEKAENGLIIDHLSNSNVFLNTIISTILQNSLSPFVRDPFHRFIGSILLNPYSSTITFIKDKKINDFKTTTSTTNLCTRDSIYIFRNNTIRNFITFCHTMNYCSDLVLDPNNSYSQVVYLKKDPDRLFQSLLLLRYIAESNMDQVECLIKQGIAINRAIDGKTPMTIAVNLGDIGIVEQLLRNGANPHYIESNGISYLMIAAYYGHIELAKLLIKKEVTLNAQDHKGKNALMCAVQSQKYGIVKELLAQEGIDVKALNKQNQSAVYLGYLTKDSEIISEFIKYFQRKHDNNYVFKDTCFESYCFDSLNDFSSCISDSLSGFTMESVSAATGAFLDFFSIPVVDL